MFVRRVALKVSNSLKSAGGALQGDHVTLTAGEAIQLSSQTQKSKITDSEKTVLTSAMQLNANALHLEAAGDIDLNYSVALGRLIKNIQ